MGLGFLDGDWLGDEASSEEVGALRLRDRSRVDCCKGLVEVKDRVMRRVGVIT